MKIAALKLEPLLTTTLDESIADAADRMRFYEVGSLGVVERGNLIGIFTERDVTLAVADRSDPSRVPVRFYATSTPTTITRDTDVEEAAALMLSLGVRHLPVLDAGRPIGMVSIRDVLVAEMRLAAEAV